MSMFDTFSSKPSAIWFGLRLSLGVTDEGVTDEGVTEESEPSTPSSSSECGRLDDGSWFIEATWRTTWRKTTLGEGATSLKQWLRLFWSLHCSAEATSKRHEFRKKAANTIYFQDAKRA